MLWRSLALIATLARFGSHTFVDALNLRASDSGCSGERQLQLRSSPSRGAACTECASFRAEHTDSMHVQSNAGLCRSCFSVKSSCDEGAYAWNCYDQNEVFDIYKRQGLNESTDEPSEMKGFVDKEPEAC
mmetsp:Transcript_21732/g.49442  ORF Transcript_21732/g.49442 Transcript_21732/m.49442 type:complete len:130 (+) Transcript_21732:53-442(+)